MCCIILDGVCFSLHGMSLCRSLRLVTAFCPEGVLWLVPFGDCGWSLRFVPLLYLRFVPFGDLRFLNAFFPTIRSRRILKQPVSPLLLGLRGLLQSRRGFQNRSTHRCDSRHCFEGSVFSNCLGFSVRDVWLVSRYSLVACSVA